MKEKNLLIQANLKATHQREVILGIALGCKNHPSTEQIYELTQKQVPSISLATVYKTLETFADKGLIFKTLTLEGQTRYDPNLEPHGHIYSSNSNEIIDYSDEELNTIISTFFKRKKVKNFHIKKISLNIIGEKIDIKKIIEIK